MSRIIGEKKNKLTTLLCPVDNQVLITDKPICKRNNWFWIIFGPAGSGKSTLLVNVLSKMLNGLFDTIHFWSPTAESDKKFKKIVKELDKDGRFYDEMTPENFTDVIDDIKDFNENFDEKEEKRKPKHLIILDDCIGDFQKGPNKDLLEKFILRRRHYKCSVIICTQKLRGAISQKMRANMNLFTAYRTNESHERKALSDTFDIPEDIYKHSTDEPYAFLHVSYLNGGKPKYFKRFNELLFKDEYE